MKEICFYSLRNKDVKFTFRDCFLYNVERLTFLVLPQPFNYKVLVPQFTALRLNLGGG